MAERYEAFAAEVERQLPGVFDPSDSEAQLPLGFIAGSNCGAVIMAMESTDGSRAAARDDARDRMIDLWTERLGDEDATTFVDLSLEIVCPEVL